MTQKQPKRQPNKYISHMEATLEIFKLVFPVTSQQLYSPTEQMRIAEDVAWTLRKLCQERLETPPKSVIGESK